MSNIPETLHKIIKRLQQNVQIV